MIPLKLQIKNFLSYGALQNINFEPYSLICLSGKNGHGKSALLDAITWAIWGQARKVSNISKSDEGLLRLGQSQMFVTLDFKVNKELYRIKREFTLLSGKSTTNLDFAVFEKNSNQYRSLTDKTIRATQNKIEQVIALTFDSFVNSAFLKQGQSNEFSKKSPKERKEILANILGLSKYEAMRKIALEKYRELLINKQAITSSQELLQNEILNKEKISQELKILEENLEVLETNKQAIKIKFEALKEEKNILSKQEDILKISKFKLEQANSYIIEQSNKLNILYISWRFINAKLTKNSFLDAQNYIKSLELKAENLKNCSQEKVVLEQLYLSKKEKANLILQNFNNIIKYEIEKNKLELKTIESELNNNNNKHADLKELYNKKKLEKNLYQEKLKEISNKLINLKNLEDNILIQEKLFDRRKNFYQKYVVTGNKLTAEIKGLDQKIILINDINKACCPLCKQEISLTNKILLLEQLSKQKTVYNHQINRISKILRSLKEIIIEQHKNIESIKNSIDQLKSDKIVLVQIETELQKTDQEILEIESNLLKIDQETKKSQNNLDIKNIDLKTLIDSQNSPDSINSNIEYKNILQEINYLKINIENTDKKISEYQKVLLELESLKSPQNSLNTGNININLEQEKLLQNNKKQEIKNIILKIKNLKQERYFLESELCKENILIQEQQKLIDQETQLNIKLDNIHKEKENLLSNRGSLEAQNKNILKIEQEYITNEQKIKEITDNIEQYQALSIAFSKDGIQALLIEEAIPEIEHEANSLLSKLTDNQAQLFIESLRDLKSGGTKETLDIKISDPSGIRSYELFSGGEAFRIDFALRIAISKLLARRAGTALETLIIDEGFGSQDEEGLSNIMDTIHKIQGDFSKVIIVSHLSSMKDQFPVHFIIQKGPNGSGVSVIENG